jgi:hypothetical protein
MRFFLARKLPAGYAAIPLPYKLSMLAGALFVAVVFIYYTNDVVSQLKENTRNDVELYVSLYQVALNEQTSSLATNLIFERVISAVDFPIIFADSELTPQYWKELDDVEDGMASAADSETLAKVNRTLQSLSSEGRSVPIISNGKLFYLMFYGDPKLVRQLQMMPFVEVGVIGVFILVGFVGFRNIKRSEQRNIWVGMAKETAHQLGTPLTGLLGWLQLLRSRVPDELPHESGGNSLSSVEILDRMASDINRLERIAQRFSLIGSTPSLAVIDLEEVVSDCVDYFRQRLPFSGNGIRIEYSRSQPKYASLNRELLSWALENTIKNALEACDAKTGLIRVTTGTSRDGAKACLEIADNGRGMSPSEVRRVFHPGYTSKKRGWGLGLTLARRIVSDYHRGEIFIKSSTPGVGTTFQLTLPLQPRTSGSRFDSSEDATDHA